MRSTLFLVLQLLVPVCFTKESRLKVMDKFLGDYENFYELLVFSDSVADDRGCLLAPLLMATLWCLF